MYNIKTSTGSLVTQIYEYQRHIALSRRFMRELMSEGLDTGSIEAEIAELERKIADLKMMCEYSQLQRGSKVPVIS